MDYYERAEKAKQKVRSLMAEIKTLLEESLNLALGDREFTEKIKSALKLLDRADEVKLALPSEWSRAIVVALAFYHASDDYLILKKGKSLRNKFHDLIDAITEAELADMIRNYLGYKERDEAFQKRLERIKEAAQSGDTGAQEFMREFKKEY